jgi:LysR family transcriptional activator of nhaA
MNLKHLRCFWAVARFGGVTRAAEKIHLTPQTLSGQISELEAQLGVDLLRPVGRRVELTEAGRMAFSYADEIFGLADELQGQLQGLPVGRAEVFRVGITDAVPRSLAYQLLGPILDSVSARLTCSHERLEVLLADLALHRLDLVLADRTVPPGTAIKAFNHVLGDTGVGLFAPDAKALKKGFPRSMHGKPLLLPGRDNVVHSQVLSWFEARKIVPRLTAEFDDSGLMKAFGAAGAGAFPGPLALREEIEQLYGVGLVGELDDVTDRYFAISTERRATHPLVLAVLARGEAILAEASRRR